jgi:hypothetical protein
LAANGLMSMTQSTGFILGPAIGGIIVTAGNPGIGIGIDAATFLASSVMPNDLGGQGSELGRRSCHG